MGSIFKKTLSGSLYATAILTMVFNPLGHLYPNMKQGLEILFMWLPLIIFVLAFLGTMLSFLLVWWLQGKPTLISDSDKFNKIESDIQEIKNQIQELKDEIGKNHNI